MTIRLAKKTDISQISKLNVQLNTLHYRFSDKQKINNLMKKHQYFVVEEGGVLLGNMLLMNTGGSYQIYILVSQKLGIGRLLIDFAVKKCQQEQIAKLWCWSLVRYKAIGFYKKMGFTEKYLLEQQFFNEDCYFLGKKIAL